MPFETPTLTRARFPDVTVKALGQTFTVFIMGDFKEGHRVVCPDWYSTELVGHTDDCCVFELTLKNDAPINRYVSVIVTDPERTKHLISASVYSYETIRLSFTKDSVDILAKCLEPWHTNMNLMSAKDLQEYYIKMYGPFIPKKEEAPKE